mmetsp:Transcript_17227/g.49968  ORF Transcript_17227/g.49968 Transcript_17227/m.49968 type:complete len:361 (+) Transcript_17227:1325-2407(+)
MSFDPKLRRLTVAGGRLCRRRRRRRGYSLAPESVRVLPVPRDALTVLRRATHFMPPPRTIHRLETLRASIGGDGSMAASGGGRPSFPSRLRTEESPFVRNRRGGRSFPSLIDEATTLAPSVRPRTAGLPRRPRPGLPGRTEPRRPESSSAVGRRRPGTVEDARHERCRSVRGRTEDGPEQDGRSKRRRLRGLDAGVRRRFRRGEGPQPEGTVQREGTIGRPVRVRPPLPRHRRRVALPRREEPPGGGLPEGRRRRRRDCPSGRDGAARAGGLGEEGGGRVAVVPGLRSVPGLRVSLRARQALEQPADRNRHGDLYRSRRLRWAAEGVGSVHGEASVVGRDVSEYAAVQDSRVLRPLRRLP